ncbi:hypothetical protein E3O44_15175 [Cryobacterium algoricola]|uniref:PRC-barrel domain-containing protein n=1 Tax=Cryobacterium algoricola TaxID=1259183 RepID=A0ABY2IC43_9MICO|nr:PRC-barrel domain-containing protein [Cryobacterium algoricola]TFB84425.1 hypothetical protein E3O44_15175 [Cryobacterium algoricola]
MITLEGIDDIVVNGGVVVTSDGVKLGSVEQVFLSEDSGQPAFVTVRTGLFGMLESFVPLYGATIDGPRVVVAFDRDRIRNGPRIESDRGSITADEENELYGYYGTAAPESAGAAAAEEVTEPAESVVPGEPGEAGVPVESGAITTDAAVRPETRLPSPGTPPTPGQPHPHPYDGPHPPPRPYDGPHPHPHPPHDGPHPHGPHDGPPPVPPHLRKHEVDGRPHPHDSPHPPPPHDDPPPPRPRP